ncbi:MAG: prephenate dehydrogenase/arogenate dehydrogenase family protein [Bacillota bacterium]
MKEQYAMPSTFSSVSIVGLGLIGGSLAKSIKQFFPETRIIGVNRSDAALHSAVSEGIIDIAVNAGSADYACMADAELIILCTPVDTALTWMTALARHLKEGTVITDACSTKSALLERARVLKQERPDFCFIGGHPMAGSEKKGYAASSAHLLENAVYLLCPLLDDVRHISALERLSAFIRALGALPLTVAAPDHDFYMAAISHLPHVAASALVNTAHANDNEQGILRALAAGGFKDITRIASSPPALWRSISMSNRRCLMRLLREYMDSLETFYDALEREDSPTIEDFFLRAQQYRDSFSTVDKSMYALLYELSVDVEDKPGVVAEITRLLESEKINIKNLYIAESREMESGCLRLAFSGRASRDRAAAVLEAAGHTVFCDYD